MRWEDVNGVVLRCACSGSGSPVVLIHEMGGTLHSWDAVMPRLAAHARVLRYDQRGAGLSEKPRVPLTLDLLSDDLWALRQATGMEEPAVLVGTAVGAAIALRHALRHPGSVAGIVGFSPVTACPAERRASVLAHADRIEREGLRALEAASIPAILPEPLRPDAAAHAAARARWLANDPESFAAIYRMFAGLEMASDYPRIDVPALLIGATHDGLRPPEAVRSVAAAIPGATYRELPTGHIACVQTPDLVLEQVLGFLDRIGGMTRPETGQATNAGQDRPVLEEP